MDHLLDKWRVENKTEKKEDEIYPIELQYLQTRNSIAILVHYWLLMAIPYNIYYVLFC